MTREHPHRMRVFGAPPILYGIAVFVSSAVTLVLEITAGRLIAPYVGVSIYSWTSIIGVVLAGLSLGNWLGGAWADCGRANRDVAGGPARSPWGWRAPCSSDGSPRPGADSSIPARPRASTTVSGWSRPLPTCPSGKPARWCSTTSSTASATPPSRACSPRPTCASPTSWCSATSDPRRPARGTSSRAAARTPIRAPSRRSPPGRRSPSPRSTRR